MIVASAMAGRAVKYAVADCQARIGNMSADHVQSSGSCQQETAGITPLGVFDSQRYAQIAVQRAKDYQTAAPFPNIAIDDFLPEGLARVLGNAFPQHGDISWV